MKYLLIVYLIVLFTAFVTSSDYQKEHDADKTKQSDESSNTEQIHRFLRVPEDIIDQKEFITNSEIDLGVNLKFEANEEFLTVPTHYGKVKGFREFSSKEKPFYSFLGIPFAKPPVDDLRFKVTLVDNYYNFLL